MVDIHETKIGQQEHDYNTCETTDVHSGYEAVQYDSAQQVDDSQQQQHQQQQEQYNLGYVSYGQQGQPQQQGYDSYSQSERQQPADYMYGYDPQQPHYEQNNEYIGTNQVNENTTATQDVSQPIADTTSNEAVHDYSTTVGGQSEVATQETQHLATLPTTQDHSMSSYTTQTNTDVYTSTFEAQGVTQDYTHTYETQGTIQDYTHYESQDTTNQDYTPTYEGEDYTSKQQNDQDQVSGTISSYDPHSSTFDATNVTEPVNVSSYTPSSHMTANDDDHTEENITATTTLNEEDDDGLGLGNYSTKKAKPVEESSKEEHGSQTERTADSSKASKTTDDDDDGEEDDKQGKLNG
ncbi:uncharacterized protein BX664DRAFT_34306 [Halteromyces radiatus]|uniref:uncharacterized protein n=1 Tax=Halteromyces radiatus TaxID=101107 RepID=UPI0022212874|nr:uncharacterized protein BX664DRAFT_34306 [Halteromyces radiatus]KAI8100132.1 hypothetical protein BX664DRAFT_34306 [Halteromyces radiatus]